MTFPRSLRNDLPAGIVVFFVAVPLCLGIALASGAPLFSGLIAGILGGIVVGALSGSPLGVSGPAAGLAVIVFQAIESLGSYPAFLVAVVLGGLLQIGLGLAGAGVLGYFFPSSVIKGMLSGIGLLIVLKQLPHAVGWDPDPVGDMAFQQVDGETLISELFQASNHIEPAALFVSATALAILVVWEKYLTPRGQIFKLIQGPLVAVAFGIVFQFLTSRFAPGLALEGEHLVRVPVPESLAQIGGLFTAPDWSALANPAIYTIALTLAIVASLETLLCVEATDKLDPHKRVTPTNRELFAQGTGNMLSGMIGGLPITQVIVRSSANIQSGAESKVSAIFHGLLLLVFSLALPAVLNLIPLAVLASILFVVGFKLAKPSLFASMYKLGLTQFVPFVATIAGILFTDLLTGVLIGLSIAAAIILHRHYENSHFLHMVESDEPDTSHHVHMQLAEEVSFLNRAAILQQLAAIPDRSVVVIDMSRCVAVDQDVIEIIEDFRDTAADRGIQVEIVDQNRGLARAPIFAPGRTAA